MPVQFEQIQDKQRIVIIDSEGSSEIMKIALHILEQNKRKFDFWWASGKHSLSDAPVILIEAQDEASEENKAKFFDCQHHIIVLHHVSDQFPANYGSYEAYLAQFENLADQTPKGGTILYYQDDYVANLIAGEREREDIKLIEYGNVDDLDERASAAKGLLKRIGITDEMFDKAYQSYSN